MNGSEVLNMASTIQVRVEDELKSKSDALFKDLGTDTTTAIRMFLTQAVATNGFPSEIKRQIGSNPYAPMAEKRGSPEMQIEKDTVYVDNIFYELQDYENKMN